MLAPIVDAVGDRIEIHLDSGIRSGQDILKAVALGAKSTYIGRAFIYGLGAAGEAGVTKTLQLLHKELDLTMALCGETDITKVGHHNLLNPPASARKTMSAKPAVKQKAAATKTGTSARRAAPTKRAAPVKKKTAAKT